MAGPLTRNHLVAINRELRKVADTVAELDKIEHCGTDCQSLRDTLEALRLKLTRYKETFFPALGG